MFPSLSANWPSLPGQRREGSIVPGGDCDKAPRDMTARRMWEASVVVMNLESWVTAWRRRIEFLMRVK